MAGQSIRNPEAVREALGKASERGELLILVTPYLRFDSTFLRLEGDTLLVAATMSREDALSGLRSSELCFRFPHGFTFYEGATQLLGLGMVRGRAALKLRVPTALEEDDHRGAYRVERVGRVPVTFSTRKYQLLTGSLVNISTTGARIHSGREFEDQEVQVEDGIMATIPLEPDIQINGKCVVRYLHGRSIGVEFKPRLEGPLLESLSRWTFRKREEERERTQRLLVAGEALAAAPAGPTAVQPVGVLLVSSSPHLEDRLRELLGELSFARVPPTVQALKNLVPGKAIVILHAPALGLDDRKHLRSLVDALGGRFPILLLGTGVQNASLGTFGQEIKAGATFLLGGNPGTIFLRLVQGMLKRHFPQPGLESEEA
ncbi:MAG: PilZ domain-containing protein [Acidobacteria bacterium]|nr:PilZ domain-containing protein [Acidobacteriota bacterium]